MSEKIDVKESLKGTPRPHYLKGEGSLETSGNQGRFRGIAYFDAALDESLSDRGESYFGFPHVNQAHMLFAVWNASHIIADRKGYGKRRITHTQISTRTRPTRPNQDLLLNVELLERKIAQGNSYGTIRAKISDQEGILATITSRYCAELKTS